MEKNSEKRTFCFIYYMYNLEYKKDFSIQLDFFLNTILQIFTPFF